MKTLHQFFILLVTLCLGILVSGGAFAEDGMRYTYSGTAYYDDFTITPTGVTAGTQSSLKINVLNSTSTDWESGQYSVSDETNIESDSVSATIADSLYTNHGYNDVIYFTPSAVGAFSFEVTITYTDVDDSNNTDEITITISGTAQSPAEIVVKNSSDATISDGATDTLSTSPSYGVESTVTYTIANDGTADLTSLSVGTASASNVTIDSVSSYDTTVSASSSTTVTVTYTPSAAGDFSFNLVISADDVDDYTITVSGTAVGPEITVKNSSGTTISSSGNDTVTGSPKARTESSVTYTIANDGGVDLSITDVDTDNASNVTIDSVSSYDTTVSASSSTTVTVTYTPSAAGEFSFDLVITSDDSDEGTYTISVNGTADSYGPEITVTGSNSNDIESGDSVSVADTTTVNAKNTASYTIANTGDETLTISTYQVSDVSSDLSDVSVSMTSTSIAADSSTSLTLNYTPSKVGSFSMTITLASNDADEGTFSFVVTGSSVQNTADIETTKQVIAAFVTERADRIISAQPDLVTRLSDFGHQSGGNAISASSTETSTTASVKLSMQAFANRLIEKEQAAASSAALKATQAVADTEQGTALSQALLGYADERAGADAASSASNGTTALPPVDLNVDIWTQGSIAATKTDTYSSTSALMFAGLDYRVNKDLLVGLLGEFDSTDQTSLSDDTSASGKGWMVGPYSVVRLHQNLYLDARVEYGQSYNKVNALGLYTDDFNTDRALVQAGLTGDFKTGLFTFNPFVKTTYYWEEQAAYTDTAGNNIPTQDFDLGRVEFGPKLSAVLPSDNDVRTDVSVSLSGIYDFNKLQNDSSSSTVSSSDEDVRGKLALGTSIAMPEGLTFTGNGYYDGLGTDNYHTVGLSLGVKASF